MFHSVKKVAEVNHKKEFKKQEIRLYHIHASESSLHHEINFDGQYHHNKFRWLKLDLNNDMQFEMSDKFATDLVSLNRDENINDAPLLYEDKSRGRKLEIHELKNGKTKIGKFY